MAKKERSRFAENMKSHLLYGGISRTEFDQVRGPVAAANKKSLEYWSVLVSLFWIYCIVMSMFSAEYGRCRPAYITALASCIVSYLCVRIIVKRFPKTLSFFEYFFRLMLLGGGIGIAVCQPDLRSLTMFAVAIILPSIFIDSTVSSLIVDVSALIVYIILGRAFIAPVSPAVYSWSLGNFILFSVFGLLIGNAINKERFERYVYADSEKKLAEIQKRYAYYDQMTGLKNRRAYDEELEKLAKDAPAEYCVVMADINGLKDTNDKIGHEAGDELINGASECLLSAFGWIDTIYRIGGDEFAVVLTGPIDDALVCLAQLEMLSSGWRGKFINGISISTGVASSAGHDDVASITAEADKNMYENKQNYYKSIGIDRKYH